MNKGNNDLTIGQKALMLIAFFGALGFMYYAAIITG